MDATYFLQIWIGDVELQSVTMEWQQKIQENINLYFAILYY